MGDRPIPKPSRFRPRPRSARRRAACGWSPNKVTAGAGMMASPGPAAPDGNDSSVSRDGGAGRGNADARRADPAADPPPPTEEVDYRWVADYQRAEIRSLEARIGELERRLRLRTVALSTTLALAGLGVIGGAYLAVGPLVKPEPAQATPTATGTGPGGRLAGTADPAAKAQVPGPEPGAEPPNPPAEVREAGPLPSPEAGPPVRAESSGADERPAAPTVGDTAERTALEKLEAKDPSEAGTANGATRSDPDATGGTAAGAAAPQSPPNATRDDAVGAAAVPHAAAASPENEAGGRQTEAPPTTPPGQGGGGGLGGRHGRGAADVARRRRGCRGRGIRGGDTAVHCRGDGSGRPGRECRGPTDRDRATRPCRGAAGARRPRRPAGPRRGRRERRGRGAAVRLGRHQEEPGRAGRRGRRGRDPVPGAGLRDLVRRRTRRLRPGPASDRGGGAGAGAGASSILTGAGRQPDAIGAGEACGASRRRAKRAPPTASA